MAIAKSTRFTYLSEFSVVVDNLLALWWLVNLLLMRLLLLLDVVVWRICLLKLFFLLLPEFGFRILITTAATAASMASRRWLTEYCKFSIDSSIVI